MRGFAVPLLLIVVVLLGGLTFYLFSTKNYTNVKGVSTGVVEPAVPGVKISIIATASQTWDMSEYLCISADECLASLSAGKRLSTVSGGMTDLREIAINNSDVWKDYSYLKVYVRPSSLVGGKMFKVLTAGDVVGTKVEKVSADGGAQDVVLIPLESLSTNFYKSAVFSDR